MDMYSDFCRKCIEGKVGYKKDFYILDSTPKREENASKSLEVSIVTPTQAAVEQAKSEIKDQKPINRALEKKYLQTGGRGTKSKHKQQKKKVKKVVKRIGKKRQKK